MKRFWDILMDKFESMRWDECLIIFIAVGLAGMFFGVVIWAMVGG